MEYTVLEQVKIRLKQFHIDDSSGADVTVFDEKEDNVLLEQLIKQAREDVISRRMYPDNYTDEQIEVDLKKFESVIVNLCMTAHRREKHSCQIIQKMGLNEVGEIETAS